MSHSSTAYFVNFNSLITLVSYIYSYHWPHDSIYSTSKWDEQWLVPKEVIFILLGH